MFHQRDLYTTIFGTEVNDEVERYLFGGMDVKGKAALEAFLRQDYKKWNHHFTNLFDYIDVQKLRTPKGLDWLRVQFPTLSQNELMIEMQGVRQIHCTIWTSGVREVVSAIQSDVKFIITDHPVTIYNHAVPPDSPLCKYPNDPSIALKASQTIFPLNRDHCLILTNLEYAKDPSTAPLDKRTFARNFGNSLVQTHKFIRTRHLNSSEVSSINFIMKARAKKYIAAGRLEWLCPEATIKKTWGELQTTLLPPSDQLFELGGEMFVKYKDGHVHYQDEFGRTETEVDYLKKNIDEKKLRPKDLCGCGSGKRFKNCCYGTSPKLRPTWKELSIRERNLKLYDGIANLLELHSEKDWLDVRKEMTDEKIRTIYIMFATLWPLETDLLELLPRPDGKCRAVYSGYMHPEAIAEFALGAPLYFGEVLISHPFIHPRKYLNKFSPINNPRVFRHDILRSLATFFAAIPLVDAGLINLVPDPTEFDDNLRRQMWHMARARTSSAPRNPRHDSRIYELMKRDAQSGLLLMSDGQFRSQIKQVFPDMAEDEIQSTIAHRRSITENDPFAVLQPDSLGGGKDGGQLILTKLMPNYEIAMYLAQATGSFLVTDSEDRWREISVATKWSGTHPGLAKVGHKIDNSTFRFLQNPQDTLALIQRDGVKELPSFLGGLYQYLNKANAGKALPNFEAQLVGKFAQAYDVSQSATRNAELPAIVADILCAFPKGGIQDNNINRLLLMSSSENHLRNVPLAFYIRRHGGLVPN